MLRFWKNIAAPTAVFALAGPLTGGLVMMGALTGATFVSTGRFAPDDVMVAKPGDALILTVLFSYLAGLLPALTTGLIASLLSPKARRSIAWIGLCAAIGFAITFVFQTLTSLPLVSDPQIWINSLLIAGAGAVAAAVCGLLTLPLRAI